MSKDKDKVNRKLRAILSADVKGYSLLMADNEADTVRKLEKYRALMFDLIQSHSGRVVDAVGDNLLAEFSSAVDAVQCSVNIQENLRLENQELTEERRLCFRIGINIGDVIQDGERIFGSGVNVAARIEALAEPGGVCISRNTYDQIKEKLEYGFQYLGDHKVKNIKDPVRVYKVLMAPEDAGKRIGEKQRPRASKWIWSAVVTAALVFSIFGYQFHQKISAPQSEPAAIERMAYPLPAEPSIAVLAFDNMTGDPEQIYFSDGISEQIITSLSNVPFVFVIARNSTFSYKNKAVKTQQIAEELGVQYVLEGSVQRSGERVRITAQLINALTGRHLWAESYDRKIEDIFRLMDEITMEIIAELQVKFSATNLGRAVSIKTDSLKAYEKYLRGYSHLWKRTIGDTLEARKLAQQATELDPQYGAAYRLWAITYMDEIYLHRVDSRTEFLQEADKLIKESIKHSGYDFKTHEALSHLYFLNNQFAKAIAEGRKAIELTPSSASSNFTYGMVLSLATQYDEAINVLQKALRLNPVKPINYLNQLAMAYLHTEQYDKAIPLWTQALERNPDYYYAHLGLSAAYQQAGKEDKARQSAAELLRVRPSFTVATLEKRFISKDEESKKRILQALVEAGLPESLPGEKSDYPSIAVLPFENMSGSPDQHFFTDGLTEQIITSLSKAPFLLVMSRQSSFAFREKQMTVQQIARELEVEYVLEGSVQRSGERIRINAQLVDARSGHHLWAENYDRDLIDIFALQDDIAIKIMAALQVNLTIEQLGNLAARKTKSFSAYEKFLIGYEHLMSRTVEGVQQAKKLAEEAIALDPDYSGAYQLLASTYLDEVWYYRAKSVSENLDKVEELVDKSIDLSGQDATSHYLLGIVYFFRRQYDEAVRESLKAVELGPGSANANFSYGRALRYAGRFEEAIHFFKKAIRLTPIATPLNYQNNLAWAYLFAEHYENAISLWNKAIQRNPDYLFAYMGLTLAYQLSGEESKARKAAAEAMRIKPDLTIEKMRKGPATNNVDREKMFQEMKRAGIPE